MCFNWSIGRTHEHIPLVTNLIFSRAFLAFSGSTSVGFSCERGREGEREGGGREEEGRESVGKGGKGGGGDEMRERERGRKYAHTA